MPLPTEFFRNLQSPNPSRDTGALPCSVTTPTAGALFLLYTFFVILLAAGELERSCQALLRQPHSIEQHRNYFASYQEKE
jgi:hypothetical protein